MQRRLLLITLAFAWCVLFPASVLGLTIQFPNSYQDVQQTLIDIENDIGTYFSDPQERTVRRLIQEQVAKRTPLNDIDQGATICAMADGKVVALAKFEGGEIRPFRVLNL